MKSKIVILICCFSLFATTVYAENCFFPDSVLFYGYRGEGEFVETPAMFGSCVGALAGGIVGLPFGLLGAPFGKFEEAYTTVGGIIVPQSCSFITGLPFYLTKKVFYDFPKAVIE